MRGWCERSLHEFASTGLVDTSLRIPAAFFWIDGRLESWAILSATDLAFEPTRPSMRANFVRRFLVPHLTAVATIFICAVVQGQALSLRHAAPPQTELADALPAADWQRVDNGVVRALAWLAANQETEGAFPTRPEGQPAVSSLCVLGFLSAGHQPGQGKYGELMNRAIDFVLECQTPSRLLSCLEAEAFHVHQGASHAATFNYAIFKNPELIICRDLESLTFRPASAEQSISRREELKFIRRHKRYGYNLDTVAIRYPIGGGERQYMPILGRLDRFMCQGF
jgi:hypothetical protein